MRHSSCALGVAALLAIATATSASPCPSQVTAAALKSYPGAVVGTCTRETEDGILKFEVKITLKNGKPMELDMNAAGAILMTEESVALDAVPPAVMTAFEAKFPGTKPSNAEKQTAPDGKVDYELTFAAGTVQKEATFSADGTLVEEPNDLDDEEGQD